MIQIPGKHMATNKNRSSKHLYFLTKRGIRMLNKWNADKGIPVYEGEKSSPKKVDKKTDTAK